MGNIVEFDCRKVCNINIKESDSNVTKNTIISNSNDNNEKTKNKYHYTECSNSISNYNSSIIQNNLNTEVNENDEKNVNNSNKKNHNFQKVNFIK